MARLISLAYGVTVYGFFFVTLLYLIGFVGDVVAPKTINSGEAGPLWLAVLVDVLLVALFGVQHGVMARPAFKKWWTRLVPEPVERSTFVLAASAVLCLMFWQWRPITSAVWEVDAPFGRYLLHGLAVAGWGLMLLSSFLIDHFDLFGLRQVVLHARRMPYTQHPFVERSVYRLVRHPLMLGLLIAFWATPTMTVGHMLFAIAMTVYILIGIHMEERDLVRSLGSPYRDYQARTAKLIPSLSRGSRTSTAATTETA
jgi:methanethiol S-methyltransferase